tara:strand:- start:1713 stop:2075 length:363 start_codon:yes stop_codon:yes gene_type:complete
MVGRFLSLVLLSALLLSGYGATRMALAMQTGPVALISDSTVNDVSSSAVSLLKAPVCPMMTTSTSCSTAGHVATACQILLCDTEPTMAFLLTRVSTVSRHHLTLGASIHEDYGLFRPPLV